MRISDWSSDVCSSDLPRPGEVGRLSHALLPRARRAAGSGGDASGTLRARQGDAGLRRQGHRPQPGRRPAGLSHEGIEGGDGAMTATPPLTTPPLTTRSEERRVGRECVRTCRSRWSTDHSKKNKTDKVYTNRTNKLPKILA